MHELSPVTQGGRAWRRVPARGQQELSSCNTLNCLGVRGRALARPSPAPLRFGWMEATSRSRGRSWQPSTCRQGGRRDRQPCLGRCPAALSPHAHTLKTWNWAARVSVCPSRRGVSAASFVLLPGLPGPQWSPPWNGRSGTAQRTF